MNYYIAKDRFGNYDLCHHGILGMKWGIRRFQNKDGSLTAAGKVRYSEGSRELSQLKKNIQDYSVLNKKQANPFSRSKKR